MSAQEIGLLVLYLAGGALLGLILFAFALFKWILPAMEKWVRKP